MLGSRRVISNGLVGCIFSFCICVYPWLVLLRLEQGNGGSLGIGRLSSSGVAQKWIGGFLFGSGADNLIKRGELAVEFRGAEPGQLLHPGRAFPAELQSL